jgi:hypothetical protein
MTEGEWDKLLDAVGEMYEWFPDGLVVIGGIAVYAHAKSKAETANLAAQSHDADFMILTEVFMDLRDIAVVTANKRLGKHHFVQSGFDFDVYVENQNDLKVPVQEAVASSEIKCDLRVACIEHLLILKAAALQDRKGTQKGDKDEDDMLRILLVADRIDECRILRLTDDLLLEVQRAVKGNAPLRLAKGNAHVARNLRNKAEDMLEEIRIALKSDCVENKLR